MKRFLTVVIVLLLFFAIGAGALLLIRNLGRSTVLTNPCDPPCWHEIRPGETQSWQAVDILQRMREVGGIQQWEDTRNDDRSSIGWLFTYPVNDAGGYIYCRENQVEAILIETWNALKLGEVLDAFGEPESQWMHVRTGSRWILEVVLIYPERGIFVQVDTDLRAGETSTELNERSRVVKVVYLDPSQIEYYLSRRMFSLSHEMIMDRMMAWEGLGTIDYSHLLEE